MMLILNHYVFCIIVKYCRATIVVMFKEYWVQERSNIIAATPSITAELPTIPTATPTSTPRVCILRFLPLFEYNNRNIIFSIKVNTVYIFDISRSICANAGVDYTIRGYGSQTCGIETLTLCKCLICNFLEIF